MILLVRDASSHSTDNHTLIVLFLREFSLVRVTIISYTVKFNIKVSHHTPDLIAVSNDLHSGGLDHL